MTETIDPWGSREVKIDESLIRQFGLSKFERPEKFRHYLFERGIVVAHRDFGQIEERIKSRKPFIQLTGIASSGKLHFGHKVDVDLFLFFKSLGAKSKFAVCDIDAYVSRPDSKLASMEEAKQVAVSNASHLLALGIEKEDIYLQSQKEPRYYEFAFALSKKITENSFRAIYGHLEPGKLAANLLQYADILHLQLPEYFGPMPSITGIGIEQDPHARASRDIAKRLPYKMFPPSFVYFTHQSALQEGKKMSSSEPDTAIFLDDSPSQVESKIKKAFSGGRMPVEEHRRLGGIPEIDKSFEILKYHHPDSKLVDRVYKEYKSGRMLTGELKKITIEFLCDFLSKHQDKARHFQKTAEKMVYGSA